jgi:hypothetical protein
LAFPFCDRLEETLHIWCFEWGLESAHLVDDATEGPDIGFAIVGLVFPYFGACVVGGACLGVEEAIFCNFGDVHIAEFDMSAFGEEDVCALRI